MYKSSLVNGNIHYLDNTKDRHIHKKTADIFQKKTEYIKIYNKFKKIYFFKDGFHADKILVRKILQEYSSIEFKK